MRSSLKVLLVSFIIVLVYFGSSLVYRYYVDQAVIEVANICQDDELILKLIDQNINPFSKFKFIKKRNADCNVLLAINKASALETQNVNYCSILDASTNSVTSLVATYVDDLYDRETASKELRTSIRLMIPYNYCNQYYPNTLKLIKLKKRLGL